MADPDDVTIKLKGEDNTGAAFKSAEKNVDSYIRKLEKATKLSADSLNTLQRRARDTHRPYEELLQNAIRFSKETDAFHRKQADALTKHGAALGEITSELGGMVKGYLSVGAAVEAARRSFVGFANLDDRFRKLQNTTGLTKDKIDELKESFKELAKGGFSTSDDVFDAFDTLKNKTTMSVDEIKKILPLIVQQQQAFGGVAKDYAAMVGDAMRTFQIPAEEANKAVNMISEAFRHGVNVDELKGNLAGLATQFSQLGVSGTEGFAQMMAAVEAVQTKTGDAKKAVDDLNAVFKGIRSDEVANMFGLQTAEHALNFLRRSKAPLAELAGRWAAMSEAARNAIRSTISPEMAEALDAMAEKMDKALVQTYKNAASAAKEAQNAAEGPQGAINRLIQSIIDLKDKFGELLNTMGVSKEIDKVTGDIRALNRALEDIKKILSGEWTWSGAWNRIYKNFPSPYSFASPEQKKFLEQQKQEYDKSKSEQNKNYDLFLQEQGKTPWAPMSYRPDEGAPAWQGMLQRASYQPGGGGGGREAYGSSTDVRYLNAAYRAGYSGSFGGYDRGPPPGPGPSFSPAGPNKSGTSYGPSSNVPQSAFPKKSDGTNSEGPSTASATPNQGGGAPPTAVLAEAEKVANLGPGAVEEYMRSAGYPKNGAWCGEFAASVIKKSGGTPPANPQVASNWRNYGEEVTEPQPGDIAVRRPEYHGRLGTGKTGDTGSHVTIVSSVDPKTGRFGSIGGNQGAIRADQSTKKYQFYRAKPGVQPGTQPSTQVAGPPETAAPSQPGMVQQKGGKNLTDFVKFWESFNPHPFQDYGGTNIGYGTRARPGETSITEEEATKRMNSELARDRAEIEKLNPNLSEGSKKALTSLLYNLGGDVNKLKKHGMAEAIAANDINAMKKAHVEFSHVGGPTGKILPGLRKRREDELQFYDEKSTGTAAPSKTEPAKPQPKEDTVATKPRPELTPNKERPERPSQDLQMNVKLKVNDNDVQFARASMRRQADREVREARWNSYADIGAA